MNLIDNTPIALTGINDSLLSEIAERLSEFAQTGQSASIDLRSLPMSDADRQDLETRLGHGEVEVKLDVAGLSEIWETSFAGVWWVRHFGGDNHITAEEINIISVPDILHAHQNDARAAASRLSKIIKEERHHG
ncbi:MAG: hydrogenase expression/formation protein [Robiginitomaculum sp.]|nr:MAG: hydrogenase expression/formation protein [Robiginitomaculum sp.]